MKNKLLLLLLLATSSISIAQTTLVNKLKITGNTPSTTATKVNVQEADGTVNTMPIVGFENVIEVDNYAALPSAGLSLKLYVTKDANKLYRWNGSTYVDVAITDIGEKEDKASKQNSLAFDGTGLKYPTADAINSGIVYKRTIAQIRALSGFLSNTSFYTTDKSKEGNWYYDSTDTTSADNTGTILVTSDGKRIKRLFDNGVSINWFGASISNTASQNTTAIQSAISWAMSNNGGKIRIPIGVYSVNPIHIPYVSINTGRIMPIEIAGEVMPSQLFGTIFSLPLASSGSVLSSSSTSTGQSVIIVDKHPTDFGNFSAVKPIIRNLDIRTYQNSQIGGIDAKYAEQLIVENCQITNGVYSVDSELPTYPNAVGLSTPNKDNAALTRVHNVSISGFYTGIIVNEHTEGHGLNLTCNLNAMEFKTANHSSNFGKVDVQRNTVGLKFSGIHTLNFDNLNLEHAGDTQTTPSNIWQKTTYDVDDSLNLGRGLISWYSVLGASGNTPDDFRKNGGEKVKYVNLSRSKTETSSSTFGGEYRYNSDLSIANSRTWRTKNDYPIAGSWALQVASDSNETSFDDVITSDRSGVVSVKSNFNVFNATSSSIAVTSFKLKNNDGSSFGDGGSFFQTNNFGYLKIQPNQTNIYGYKSGGVRVVSGLADIHFATGNADLDNADTRMTVKSSGSVLINTSTDIPSSKLTVSSTSQGVLIPRMTTAQKNAIVSPAEGLQVYDLTLHALCFYNGTVWKTVSTL